MTNRERAMTVVDYVIDFGREHYPNEDFDTVVQDMITNLLHAVDDPKRAEEVLRLAVDNYRAEVEEEVTV